MNVRLCLLAIAAVSATLPLPREALAVDLTLTDACGKSLTGNTNTTVTVNGNSNGAINVTSFSAPYAVGIGQCDAPAADNKPRCTVSASNATLELGGSATVHAKCTTPSGSPITSYTWAGPPAGPIPGNLVNSASLTFPDAGAYTYSVSATNGAGAGPMSAPTTVLVGNSALTTTAPTCVVTVTPTQILQGESAKLQVVCQPVADTYTWTNPAGVPAASGSGGSLAFTGTPPNVYTYLVKGKRTGSADGPTASATINVKSNGTCTPGGVHFDLPLTQYQMSADVQGGDGFIAAFGFQTAGAATFAWQYHASYNIYYFPTNATWAVSQCKGDFAVAPGCTSTLGGQYAQMSVGTAGGPGCSVQPNTQYYVNIRVNTCGGTGVCGYRMYRN